MLAPALGALVGPQLLAAISMVIATALFARLIDGCFPARAARIAAAWFAFGASVSLLSSRVPFDLGLAIGLGALLLARRRRLALALALSVLTALASPVAGAFLALAFLAWALSGPARAWPAALTVAALAPIGAARAGVPGRRHAAVRGLRVLPGSGGSVVVGALVERGRSEIARRAIVIGAALYALALIGSYVLPTAVGGNADRLGALAAGPVAACVLAGASRGRRRLLVVLAPFLLYWQANAPATDFASTVSNPSVHASYYSPLLGELRALRRRLRRAPGAHRGGRDRRPLGGALPRPARDDRARLGAPAGRLPQRPLLRRIQAADGRALPRVAVRERGLLCGAAADATLDYSAQSEARLLTRVGRRTCAKSGARAHWRLFAVLGASPLAQAPALLTAASSDSLTLYAPRPGSYTVRVRFTPYWALASGSGCVAAHGGEWTEVRARRAGSFHVVIRFSLARVFSDGASLPLSIV